MKEGSRQAESGEPHGVGLGFELGAIMPVQADIDRNLLVTRQGRAPDPGIPLQTAMRRRNPQRPPAEIAKRLQTIEKIRRMPVLTPTKPPAASTGKLCDLEVGPSPVFAERGLRQAW